MRDAVAEGVADHERSAAILVLDHRGDVGGTVVQIDAGKRAAALPNAARLRPQHPMAGGRQPVRHDVEIARAAPERWQQHDHVSVSLRQDLDAYIAARNEGSLRPRRHPASLLQIRLQ
jgi:hypothetical protein